jgi:hypothetical protein
MGKQLAFWVVGSIPTRAEDFDYEEVEPNWQQLFVVCILLLGSITLL